MLNSSSSKARKSVPATAIIHHRHIRTQVCQLMVPKKTVYSLTTSNLNHRCSSPAKYLPPAS